MNFTTGQKFQFLYEGQFLVYYLFLEVEQIPSGEALNKLPTRITFEWPLIGLGLAKDHYINQCHIDRQ